MKKILITGISGYLAPYLSKAFLHSGKYLIYGIHNLNKPEIDGVNLLKCNLLDTEKLKVIFENLKPDVVYHLASVTPSRITNEDDIYISNFNGGVSGEIAKLCTAYDALMIYTSTDLVYKNGKGLSEDLSPIEPLSIYAKTKLEGELAVKQFAKKFIILRTSLIYGFTLSTYTSFFDVSYKLFTQGKEVRAYTDQYRNPLYTEDAAKILKSFPDKYKKNDVVNFCGGEYISRYEMCLQMCEIFGFKSSLVKQASADEFTSYLMVKELGLNNDKLISYGFKTGKYYDSLIRAKNFKPLN